MYKKLLIPLDGSQLSEAILPYARVLAKGLKIPVDLLRIIEREVIEVAVNPKRNYFFDDVEADLRSSCNDYLAGVAASFVETHNVNCVTFVGDPAEVIVDTASVDPDALIAMSTHGRSGIQRWYLGSVADKVLHASTNPMLLAKGTAQPESQDGEATIKRIIVPLDGSPLAERALPHATVVAQALHAELDMVSVCNSPTHAYYAEGLIPNFDENRDAMQEEAKNYLDVKAEQLSLQGVENASCIIETGDAGARIIELAQQTPNSLVTMCSHGRSGIGRWVLGGTTDRVVRYSGDPVLVIRASGSVGGNQTLVHQ